MTESPSDFQRQLVRIDDDRFLRPALGLHPLRAARMSGSEVERFFASIDRADYIGEIGIDRSRDGKPTEARQIQLFERVLSDPRIQSKVLTIHSRGAAKEVVERMEQTSVFGILHWYTGSLSVAERALAAGLYFSINPSMLRAKSGRRLIALLPRNRVLTETDGPYTRFRGRISEPSDIPAVIEGLADVWGEDPVRVGQQVFRNMSDIALAVRRER